MLAHLDAYLLQFEAAVTGAGGHVHWAADAAECNAIVLEVARAHGVSEVVKVKSLTTDEIGLNAALAAGGVHALETDLAELILQLDGDWSSHILVPAIHRNRTEIRDLFRRTIADPAVTDDPRELAEASRVYLREKFLKAQMAVSGANFGVAETGTVCVVESEGNGRMCTTLPPVLVTILGIEKLVPAFGDLEVFLQLLPRSSTGERMNPYTSLWTGVTPGDGPEEFHVILLDAGRTRVLADEVGRQALHCIRCSACLNVCPVYSRTGGHAYGSVYPGPIGAILTPQLHRIETRAVAALRLEPLRRLLRGLPGHDRHPERAPAPAREGGGGDRQPGRAGGHERPPAGCSTAVGVSRSPQRLGRLGQRPFLRGGTIRAPARRRSAPGRARAICVRSPRRELPRMVGAAAMSGSRELILARVRDAVADRRPPSAPPRSYRRSGARDRDAAIDLLCERIGRLPRRRSAASAPEDFARRSSDAFAQRGAARICVPAAIPAALAPGRRRARRGRRARPTPRSIELDGVLTGCTLAIAETGTIVLTAARRPRAGEPSAWCPTCTSASSARSRSSRLVPAGDGDPRRRSCARSAARSRSSPGLRRPPTSS